MRPMFFALLLLTLAGCGGQTSAPPAPTTHASTRKPSQRVAASAADIRFAQLVVVDDREDLSADALGKRKSSSAALSGAARQRATEQTAEIALATRFLARAHARAAPPASAQRRAWAGDYAALVDVAGYRFDEAFTANAESRDRAELAAARAELRVGDSSQVKALARKAVAQRAAEITRLRDISA